MENGLCRSEEERGIHNRRNLKGGGSEICWLLSWIHVECALPRLEYRVIYGHRCVGSIHPIYLQTVISYFSTSFPLPSTAGLSSSVLPS